MIRKIKLIDYFILISLFTIVSVSYVFLEEMSFFDEFFSAFIFLTGLFYINYHPKIFLYKEEKYIFYLLVFLGIWGLLSNYLTLPEHPTDHRAIFGDFVVFFKAYAAYYGIRILKSSLNSEWILKRMAYYAELFFYLLLLLVIFDLVFNLFPKEPRYGTNALRLFYNHPSRFSFAFSFIFLVLFHKYVNRNIWFLILVLSVGLFSLRVKYFGFVIVSFLIYYFKDYLKKISRKQFFYYTSIVFALLFILFYKWIDMYFSFTNLRSGWSRGVMLITSVDIGRDFFPFGTGFGTYASFFSGEYYSWVYDLYNISDEWGISRQYKGFIADQFWPMVLGQFGFPGLLAYALIMFYLIRLLLKLLKDRTESLLSNRIVVALLGIFLLLIDSSSDAIFTQDRAVVIFTLTALIINMNAQSKKL